MSANPMGIEQFPIKPGSPTKPVPGYDVRVVDHGGHELGPNQEGNIVILADPQGKDLRIDRKDIDERAVSPLSPMPSNFAEQIGEADFHHLMAFLLGQRGKQ